MYDALLDMLIALDGVQQDRKFHPEGDTLYHSLQVFECAWRETDDWELAAAALLHDVGKAVDYKRHDEVGAALLDELLPPRVVWLVQHHLDLLRNPAATRALLHGTPQLADLERLRRWDLAGRCQHVWVPTPEDALALVMNAASHSLLTQADRSIDPVDLVDLVDLVDPVDLVDLVDPVDPVDPAGRNQRHVTKEGM